MKQEKRKTTHSIWARSLSFSGYLFSDFLYGQTHGSWGRSPFEDEEIESLQCEVDESPFSMSEETSEIGSNHTLPSIPISLVELLPL